MESKGKHYRVEVVDLPGQLLIFGLCWIVTVAMDGGWSRLILLSLTYSQQLRRWMHWPTSRECLVRR